MADETEREFVETLLTIVSPLAHATAQLEQLLLERRDAGPPPQRRYGPLRVIEGGAAAKSAVLAPSTSYNRRRMRDG